jgi:formamidopyrimidine-DNA glycosylase
MPELPEVETIARGVNERLHGDRIVEVWFGGHREPFKTPAARQAKGLEGRSILAVHRTGKHIVCELGSADVQLASKKSPPAEGAKEGSVLKGHDLSRAASGSTSERALAPEGRVSFDPPVSTLPAAQWIVHLGMTGRLLVTVPEAPVAIHTHARLSLASGRELRFVDPRRFGRLEFRDLSRSSGFSAPGVDPLEVTAESFVEIFHSRRLAIKAALLNQTLLSGVGNIYADESLFRAGIRPRRLCGRLSGAELERLRQALHDVLLDAIRLGGSSVSDYVDADGVRGFFQLEHCVYLRTGLACLRCQTLIRRIVLAGRGTHFCPKCQV